MFCEKCGTENDNSSAFCKKCGHPLQEVVNSGNSNAGIPSNRTSANGGAKPLPKVDLSKVAALFKVLPKKILAAGAAAIAVLILVICFFVNSANTINLDKYLTIKVSGYDGYGRASYEIDWKAIEDKYGSKIDFTSRSKNKKNRESDIYSLLGAKPVDYLRDAVGIEFDEYKGLSNGNEISYKWIIDEDLEKFVTCKLKYKDGDYKVNELKEIKKFDAFKDITLEFTGTAPEGYANVNYTGSDFGYYDISCDKTNGLSNGDKIKVTLDKSVIEDCAENSGKVPETLEKEFTVEGLESYLSKLSDIDAAALKNMQTQATDVFYAKMAQDKGEGEELSSLTYIGDYLLTSKKGDGRNYLYLVYKAQIHNSIFNENGSYNQINNQYWFIRYDNLMLGSDGKVSVDVTYYTTPSDRFTIDSGVNSGWWSTMSWYYYGYNTLDELYNAVVTRNMDSYNHEDNVDESAAPAETVPETMAVPAAVPATDTTVGTTADSSEYVLPKSNSELISAADLTGFDAEKCKLARNEIYARHGRRFKDEAIQAYFDSKSWYTGTVSPDAFQESVLSDVEVANRNTITEYEKAHGFNK